MVLLWLFLAITATTAGAQDFATTTIKMGTAFAGDRTSDIESKINQNPELNCSDGYSNPAPGCFYATFFSIQKEPQVTLMDSSYSHSFASFVELNQRGHIAKHVQINWMPQAFHEAGEVQDITRAYHGVNWPVTRTLAYASSRSRYISRWGPVRISAEIFEAASQQAIKLDAGLAFYKAHGRSQRTKPWGEGRAYNCFQAIADALAPQYGILRFGAHHGEEATRMVAYFFRRGVLTPIPLHGDQMVYDLLGFRHALGGYPDQDLTHELRTEGPITIVED